MNGTDLSDADGIVYVLLAPLLADIRNTDGRNFMFIQNLVWINISIHRNSHILVVARQIKVQLSNVLAQCVYVCCMLCFFLSSYTTRSNTFAIFNIPLARVPFVECTVLFSTRYWRVQSRGLINYGQKLIWGLRPALWLCAKRAAIKIYLLRSLRYFSFFIAVWE